MPKNPIYLFEPKKIKRYPDFYNNEMILDAKYKQMDNGFPDRNDIHQIITYMFIRKVQKGSFVYPHKEESKVNNIGTLNGYGGIIKSYGVKIPQNSDSFQDFIKQIQENEKIVQDL